MSESFVALKRNLYMASRRGGHGRPHACLDETLKCCWGSYVKALENRIAFRWHSRVGMALTFDQWKSSYYYSRKDAPWYSLRIGPPFCNLSLGAQKKHHEHVVRREQSRKQPVCFTCLNPLRNRSLRPETMSSHTSFLFRKLFWVLKGDH